MQGALPSRARWVTAILRFFSFELHFLRTAFVATFLCFSQVLSFASVGPPPVTTTGSGSWDSIVPDAPWPGGVAPNPTDPVIVDVGHTLTLTGSVDCGGLTVDGTVNLDGSAGASTLTIEAGSSLSNSGSINVVDDTNPVTIQGGSGGMVAIYGTAVNLNGKSVHLARIQYDPPLSIASGETVSVDDTCEFTSLQTSSGASLMQGNYVNLTVTGAMTLASGTFTRSIGGKLKLNGNLLLNSANQNLGDVVTGP